MNSFGVTASSMGGGVSMYPANTRPLFRLWQDKQLTLRVAYHLCAPKPGSELADLQNPDANCCRKGFGDTMRTSTPPARF